MLIRHLPADSAVRRALGQDDWDRSEYLLADLMTAWTGKPHPSDPRNARKTGTSQRADQSRIAAARRRSQERRERLGITGSVLKGE